MKSATLFVVALALAAPARAQHYHDQNSPPPAPQRGGGPQTPPIEVPWNDAIPAGTVDHAARALKESPRHGEWVDIKMADGTALKSWVVYPEKANKAGVVLVIHDIRGMADITRAVGDQLAQDGFIAIVPDFLSGKGPDGGGTSSLGTGVGQAIQALASADVKARLDAAMDTARSCRRPMARLAWWGSVGAEREASSTPPTSQV